MKRGVNKEKRKVWNDRGIRRAARDLGVCHSHLVRVLRGERHSARLLGQYVAWREENGPSVKG
jgi:hypothetical protein